MTHQERKEILRCLIDHIVVAATKTRIDATIVWKTGSKTSSIIWRGHGRYELIRELHGQGLSTVEIKERLTSGQTSSGQVWAIACGSLRIMKKLGLKPNRIS